MNSIALIEKLKLNKILKSKLLVKIIICLLVAVAILIFASTFNSKKNSAQSNANVSTNYSSSVLNYSNKVASQIEDMLSNVNGLSNVKVVVVVESTPQIKYLQSGEESSGIILEKQSSVTKPVVVTEFAPKINGILIVAKGSTNLLVKNKVISALSAVYSVDMSKIDILEGK